MARFSFKNSTDLGLLILRLVFGLYMAIGHGWGKISGGSEAWKNVGEMALEPIGLVFFPVFWGFLAAIAEFFGALLVAAGFATRIGSALLMGTMIMAASMHIITGNGSPEQAIMYFGAFLVVFIAGPGTYSVDGRR